MAAPVKMVYSKLSVLKKVRLSVQAVHMEVTGIIINNKKRSMGESGFKDMEGIATWVTHRSAAPQTHSTLYALYSVFVQHDKGGLSTMLTIHASLNVLEACSESLKIQFLKVHNHTKLPLLDDLQACSGSSKSGLYKTSILGRFTSMLRIIQSGLYKTSTFG